MKHSDAAEATKDRARRILVIFNPTAGGRRRRAVDRLVARLARSGAGVELRPTAARGDAERFARESGGFDAVVAAGGDGTINEIVNGLAALDGTAPPLAILPLGTANVLAGELGLERGTVYAAIGAGLSGRIHAGSVNGRRFALMVGVGFDARVVEHLDPALKRRLGKLAYWLETLRQLWRYRPQRYSVEVDGRVHDAAAVIVTKARRYGGAYVLAPAARLGEPLLHVCLFGASGRLSVLRYGAALVLGRVHRLKDVRILPARRVRIAGPAGEAVQGDGDIVGHLPVEITLAEGTVRVLGAQAPASVMPSTRTVGESVP
jgi:diacylglycerol kinase (ATP)